jgi:hypothetical protein
MHAGLEASKKNCEKMIKQGLVKLTCSFVVGSDRGPPNHQGTQGILLDAMYGPDVDLSHAYSFDGNAYTIDLNESYLEEKDEMHVIDDATTYDFSKRFNIKHALIERFPTTKKGSAHFSIYDMERTANNYIGKCITQLSHAMQSEAILEIELEPFLTILSASPEFLDTFHVKNPFQGAFDWESVLHSLAHLNSQLNNNTSQDIHNTQEDSLEYVNHTLVEQIHKEILFYHNTLGVCTSVNQIVERLIAEVGLIHQMSVAMGEGAAASNLLVDCVVNEDTTEVFINAAKHAILTSLPDNDTYLDVHEPSTNTYRQGFVYTLSNFMQHTFFNYVLCSIAVQNNTLYIDKFLNSVGFKDICVERRTNVHNGRQNVWMVKAIKV